MVTPADDIDRERDFAGALVLSVCCVDGGFRPETKRPTMTYSWAVRGLYVGTTKSRAYADACPNTSNRGDKLH